MYQKIWVEKRRSLRTSFPLMPALQRYVASGSRKSFAYFALELPSGTLTISSSSSQFRASQIISRCSRFTLSTNSWYNSLIVLGRMPVALARSACVIFRSPSLVDSKILIIRHCSFRYKITPIGLSVGVLLFYNAF